ncbi:hypothetical protein BB560_004283 [Smittium megazygosporum]|uniref:Rho GDP-dissociation inhibitor n=1 Tax=Smittium megazygosporum TaxID=133381 RepID=A0A2T9Z9M5_9FUNG|nr:hypothetical protein BB560_004283 [Smittium megazygosporum]
MNEEELLPTQTEGYQVDAIAALSSHPLVLKEGITYRLKIRFKQVVLIFSWILIYLTFSLYHDLISGLKYLHQVKRKGIPVDRVEEMLGSYGPSETPYDKRFLPEEAPAGLLARGKYNVKSKFVDDDGIIHLEWSWVMEIKKDWS